MNLKCNKTNCKYNNAFACKAKEVHITENTDCETFDKDYDKSPEELKKMQADMFELGEDMAQYKHGDKVKIKCSAKCVFNRDGDCSANGITVIDKLTDGICGTFVKE